jgi:predicted O-methyltransferase YrrM
VPTFTEDWFDWHAPQWERLFAGLGWDADLPHAAVEIGSFEGRSTLWILENLLRHPDSRLRCIDTFAGGAEHDEEQTDGLYERFRANLAGSAHGHKAEILREPSFDGLSRLLARGDAAPDLVYIDGSHEAPDVLADLVLAFRLAAPGCVLICDDYLWSRGPRREHDVLNSPKLAIDAFTTIHRRRIEPLGDLHGWQVAFRKAGD